METFTIEDKPIVMTTRERAFQTLVETKEQIVKYNVVDQFKINILPALGMEGDFYFFDYEIQKRDDAIANIKVDSSSKIRLVFNCNPIDIPDNYYLYNCLFLYTRIHLRIYFHKNQFVDEFKISYDGYMFGCELRGALATKNYRDFTNCLADIKL
jgi:hypothetical protein